ncbi:hypothetical protein LRR81_08665 [Metabacillus sp. GX 13764]|uniref:hypothetical protein n=1 Tax=Metabacillus kandeliae TaxID=2900151 RepID=UPI001E6352A3|nr:hypothetical protein [Metabacillus kandeliae]MCD7034305.1 hypothetical protein [Metabacillus kandeliae]
MATIVKKPVQPTVKPQAAGGMVYNNPTATSFANAADERAYRQANPNSDYTKSVDMRFLNRTSQALQNNTGVTAAQMKQYNDVANKWNYNTTPQIDQNKIQEDLMNKQKSYMDDYFNKQKQAQLDQYYAARDKAVGQINQQMGQVAPQYQQARNQADVVNLQNGQKLNEMMANNGLTASGENVTAQVAQNNTRQTSLNNLNLQEQQTMDDFQRRISDLNNPADENAMIMALEAERSKAMMDAYNRTTDQAYQRSRDAVGDSQWKSQFDYTKTRDARADAQWESQTKYDRSRDAASDAKWESQTKYDRAWQQKMFDYQQGRDKVGDSQWESSQKYQRRSDAEEKQWREYTYNHMSASEKANMEWAKQQFGEDMAWRMYENDSNNAASQGMSQAEIDFYKNNGMSLPGIP